MLKSNCKKIVPILLVSSALILPKQSQAAVPVVDPSVIAQVVSQTAQQAANFSKEMAVYAKQMAQDIQLFSQQMRSDFNRSIMEVGSVTQVSTDTHNLETLADLQPVPEDACVMITVNEHQNKMETVSSDITKRSMENRAKRTMPKAGEDPRNSTSGVPTPREYRLSMFEQLQDMDKKNAPTASQGSVYLNPQYMFIDNMSEEEFKIANTQKELLAGPPQEPFEQQNIDNELYKQEFVNRTRREILKSSAVYAIQSSISNRFSDEQGVSKIGSIEEYLDKTVRNPEWVKRYTNTNSDVNKLTNSSQVLRALAGIEAQRLQVDVMTYKELEQTKFITAISSLIEMEK